MASIHWNAGRNSGTVTQWEIFDQYMADIEAAKDWPGTVTHHRLKSGTSGWFHFGSPATPSKKGSPMLIGQPCQMARYQQVLMFDSRCLFKIAKYVIQRGQKFLSMLDEQDGKANLQCQAPLQLYLRWAPKHQQG